MSKSSAPENNMNLREKGFASLIPAAVVSACVSGSAAGFAAIPNGCACGPGVYTACITTGAIFGLASWVFSFGLMNMSNFDDKSSAAPRSNTVVVPMGVSSSPVSAPSPVRVVHVQPEVGKYVHE